MAASSSGRTEPPRAATSVRLPLIDSCRALAALSVLLFHVGAIGGGNADGPLRGLGSHLGIGVPIFFAISGFVLYRPFAAACVGLRPWPKLGRYARRRVLRIVPAYWAALTLLGLLVGLPGVFSGDWWRYYGFVQIYDSATFDQGLGVAWTLCIEVTFYLALPIYALALAWVRRRSSTVAGFRLELLVLLALAFGSIAFRALTAIPHTNISAASTLPGTFVWFVPGMVLALWSVNAEAGVIGAGPIHGRSVSAVCWLGAIGLYVMLCYAGLPATAGDIVVVVIAALFLLPAVRARLVHEHALQGIPERVLRARSLMWLGMISYAVYLYHAVLIAWLKDHGAARVFPLNDWIGLAFTGIVTTLFVAAASWYLLERPILQRWSATTGSWVRVQRWLASRFGPAANDGIVAKADTASGSDS